MFRALLCSSSGGQIVLIQHLVSSFCRWPSGEPDGHLHRLWWYGQLSFHMSWTDRNSASDTEFWTRSIPIRKGSALHVVTPGSLIAIYQSLVRTYCFLIQDRITLNMSKSPWSSRFIPHILSICIFLYEGDSNEKFKSAIKIKKTARLSCKFTIMILIVWRMVDRQQYDAGMQHDGEVVV
jgi:hypothetical protein